ncbi:glycosyltransferase family 2 protein [Candidatus Marinimicrobia bacterium MT.SAG.3]|nr:glycosyltransferase family 2 protein [Candidatus Marinimicrobia bacterium MT.SAG.3]
MGKSCRDFGKFDPMTEIENFPKVEVIILTWNGKEDTIECLNSLQKVKYDNFDITIVDNASTDGSAEIIAAEFPSVNLLKNNTNLMYAGGNNVAIKEALNGDAEYFLILNNDTILHEDFLEHLVKAFKSEEKVGIVAPKINYYNNRKLIWYAGGFVNIFTGNIYHRGLRKQDDGKYDLSHEVDYATGCCMLIKRELFEKIGLLDEAYYIYTEDVDFSFKAQAAGYKVVFEPRSLIWHKVSSATGGAFSFFKIKNKFRSNMRFFIIYASWYHWFTILPFTMIRSFYIVIETALRTLFKIQRGSYNG